LQHEKALVVFSGGQDSTTCLFWAKQQFSHVEAVTFAYGQRHDAEIEVAKEIAAELDVPHHILDLSLLGQLTSNALTRHDLDIDNADVPNTFVDGRNHLFLSFAAVMAKQLGMHHIVTGVCETDFSGYPDCRDIDTPLMWLDKKQTWELADQLGAFDFVKERTLTCYNGILGSGCGECPACVLRQNGLVAYEEVRV